MSQRHAIWEEYCQNRSTDLRCQLVQAYLPLVRYVVVRMGVPASDNSSIVRENDLIQFGVIGLIEAIDRYDPERGVKFETYAIPRIKGTIQDELRKLDWVPRSVRKRVRLIERVQQHVETRKDDESVDAIAAKLSITPQEVVELLAEGHEKSREIHTVDEDGLIESIPADDMSQLEIIEAEEIKNVLVQMVKTLPERQRLVISLYYYENMTFKEIATALGLSDSRVFQIHSSVLATLRKKLAEMV